MKIQHPVTLAIIDVPHDTQLPAGLGVDAKVAASFDKDADGVLRANDCPAGVAADVWESYVGDLFDLAQSQATLEAAIAARKTTVAALGSKLNGINKAISAAAQQLRFGEVDKLLAGSGIQVLPSRVSAAGVPFHDVTRAGVDTTYRSLPIDSGDSAAAIALRAQLATESWPATLSAFRDGLTAPQQKALDYVLLHVKIDERSVSSGGQSGRVYQCASALEGDARGVRFKLAGAMMNDPKGMLTVSVDAAGALLLKYEPQQPYFSRGQGATFAIDPAQIPSDGNGFFQVLNTGF